MKNAFYLLAALALGACAGPDGNLGRQPYANEPGGAIAVNPEPAAPVTYDPNAPQPVSGDMKIGQPALNPSSSPLNQTPRR